MSKIKDSNTKKEILSEINNFFKIYKENLENKDFLIIYNFNNKQNKISLRFSKENFFHLTGLERGDNSLSPLKFYQKLEQKTLNINDISIGKFTKKKLKVYQDMIKIFKEESKIGDYDPNNKYQKNLSLDKAMCLAIPNTNMVLGIRFIGGIYTVPVSLLQQNLKNISYKNSITDIICMFEKNTEDKKYNKIIYNITDFKIIIQNDRELKEILTENLLKNL